jgi:hypothetical protein
MDNQKENGENKPFNRFHDISHRLTVAVCGLVRKGRIAGGQKLMGSIVHTNPHTSNSELVCVLRRMETGESGERNSGDETIDLKELLTIEMKKNVQYQDEILLEKQQKMNLEEQLKHYKKENEQYLLIISDYKTKYQEKSAYIQLLEARVQEENILSKRKDFELTISNQESIISSLEEKIQLLEHDLLVLKQRYSKEIEGCKVEAMNAWIKIQVCPLLRLFLPPSHFFLC